MALIAFVRRTPSGAILTAQLVGVLADPFMERTTVGRAAFAILGITVLSLAVLAVRTGMSDLLPVSGQAKSGIMIEQVVGLFYVAMVVTRLIGLQAARRWT